MSDVFTYAAPESPVGVVDALAAAGHRGRVLAGGTVLVPELAQTGECAAVVDLRRAGLSEIRRDGEMLELGAGVTYAQILDSGIVTSRLPLLRSIAMAITGGPQIRNVATPCGSACYANPSSDAPACLVALDAEFQVLGPAGGRRMSADSFFVGAYSTALAEAELVTSIRIPMRSIQSQARVGYYKLKLSEGSWPIATAACIVVLEESNVTSLSLALGGVEARPVAVDTSEVIGRRANPDLVAQVGDLAHSVVQTPWSDELADEHYRRAVAGPVARRSLAGALQGL